MDRTHDPALRSWVESANGPSDFPIQNLPLGLFSPAEGPPRAGMAIGSMILDLANLNETGLLDQAALPTSEFIGSLNALIARGRPVRQALRERASDLLSDRLSDRGRRTTVAACLHEAASCRMLLPVEIGDYTDFYAGLHHATNVGRLFRPDNPLPQNYKHLPMGYHGRASSVRISGEPVRRPNGQTAPVAGDRPVFGASRSLDFELEIGVWIGRGNAQGEPIPIARAAEHVAGFCLLNDWSARDVQSWEYAPLGPFLSKSFATSVSPWIITPEALAPFRIAQAPRSAGDPAPLPYLDDRDDRREGALDIDLEVLVATAAMRKSGEAPHRLTQTNGRRLYWTVAQMIAHHTSGGCNLRPGDLLGTGTISGPRPGEAGSLLELSSGGASALVLPNGERRAFLEDGDEIILRGTCRRQGFQPIGFGECRGLVLPSPASA